MKTLGHSAAAVLVLASLLLSGQGLHAREAFGSDEVTGPDGCGFNMRTSAAIDWKIIKGLHLTTEYELRTMDSFAGVERHQASIGLDYKVCPYFKVGAEYIFIGKYNSSKLFRPRHRFSLNLTGQIDAGAWRFSLKEKLQLTHKGYSINGFQEVRNPLQLKSRFSVKYRGWRQFEPFAYFEMRNIFNAPRFSATCTETTAGKEYSDYEFLGYGDGYVNRLRGALGVDWKITKHHSIGLTAMYSFCRDKDIDTNKKGTKLKGYSLQRRQYATIGIGYTFSF